MKKSFFLKQVTIFVLGCLAITTECMAQLKFSQLPYAASDTGSYCVGVENNSGVFTNKRFRVPNVQPTLSTVLTAGNTSNTALHIHTGTNDLYVDPTYSGFAVKYGTSLMAGLRSYYSIYGALDLSSSSYTVTVVPDFSVLSANHTFYLPNADGTAALTTQLPVLRIKTLSGDGTHDSLVFNAPSTGRIVQCQSTNAASQVKWCNMSGTAVTVKFVSVPASGTNNISISYWYQ